MSFSSHSSSASSTVSLYRYDLSHGMARSMGPMLIGRPLEGIWHTSIVVFGKEYYFDGGVGIVADANPGRTRFGTPYRTEVLGQTSKRQEEFFAWTQRQRTSGFGPNDYHLLQNNCNSFSDAASMFLLGRHIPQDVLDMIPTLLATPVGQMLRPMLEQATSAGSSAGTPASPLSQPRPPAIPPISFSPTTAAPSAAPSAATGGMPRPDNCVGLLSSHQTVTEADEEELMLAQAMLESNETIADGPRSPPEAFERAISGLTLLQTVMANICEHPTEAKYRALSMESNAYKTKLKPLEPYGVADVLRIAGFVRRPHSSGSGGEQWFLSDAAGSAPLLQRVGEMLAVTISSIEGAAADAAKERGKAFAGGAAASTASVATGESQAGTESNTLKDPPPPPSPPVGTGGPDTSGSDGAAGSSVVQYCTPPFPKGWTPLAVGWEGGAALFSIHCLPHSTHGVEGPYCFGKCCLSPNQQHLQAYYCSSDGREVEVRGGYEVLCVQRGQENGVTWVPARLACTTASAAGGGGGSPTPSFIFFGYGRFGVARAEHGCGVQPGVMEPSGRCVIPYGGRAVVVTEKAEVLCETARLPRSLAQTLQELETGARLSKLLQEASGQPIGSFDELLTRWRPPAFYVKPQPLRSHTRLTSLSTDWESDGESSATSAAGGAGTGSSDPSSPTSTRLLVCHDFGGGYTAGERRLFVLEEGEGAARADRKTRTEAEVPHSRIRAAESAYTVSYWDRTDCFVYFSHQRISVPPREWIHDGHRHGVTVLGTIITEGAGGAADLDMLLSDAKRMAAIIERLVELCDVYGFDGYLLNVENTLPATMAKRLLVFCSQLRKQLNTRKASLCTARLVIWYDAITIDGELAYQNALTPRNKPFFDACDGLFTNYFWNPMHLAMTRTAAGSRGADVFVGVDVFGRRMFGGGGYNTNVAAEEATHTNLSVALFAPGWTMECESEGSRDGFERAESRMWSRLQKSFAYHTRLLCGASPRQQTPSSPVSSHDGEDAPLCAWTAFQSGVGYHFYVNGERITKSPLESTQDASTYTTSAWCELSAAHALPPFSYDPLSTSAAPGGGMGMDLIPLRESGVKASGPFAAVPFHLPSSSLQGSMYGGRVRAVWRYDKAWFGDRCLGCVLPPMEAAEVLRWHVRNALLPADTPFPQLCIDVVLGHAEEVAVPAGVGRAGGIVPAAAHRGLRLGLYSPSRGSFQVTVWEKSALAGEVPVAGALDGLKVRVSVTRGDGSDAHAAPSTSGSTAPSFSADGWCCVRYALQNMSSEALHLTSVSVANGNPSRTLRLCVGAIAVYQAPPPTSSTATSSEGGAAAECSVLRAAGPHVWASHMTHATGKGAEQVLLLSGADAEFAAVRARRGARSTVVLFASITSTVAAKEEITGTGREDGAHPTPSSTPLGDGHHMYLGQYSVDPADGTTYNGSLLIALSLPPDKAVTQVYYYTVANGY
jgi:hypothetical protein